LDIKGVQVNQRIEIDVSLPGFAGTYSSRIEEVTDTALIATLPSQGKAFLPLLAGDQILINYWGEDSLYFFETRVLERRLQPLPVLILEKPQKINRSQRREFVRFGARLPFRYSLFDGLETLDANTADISGGGISFTTPVPPREGSQMRLELELPGEKPVKAVGSVVRVADRSGPIKKRYKVGVTFLVIEEKDRDRIIKYIFARQRELRRKGLL
jgi:c-di-GMP-binding flagellar brake protein YcgR